MNTFTEIKTAVDSGLNVYWKNESYKVVKGRAGYFVKCIPNNSSVGLMHRDQIGSEFEPDEFYIK